MKTLLCPPTSRLGAFRAEVKSRVLFKRPESLEKPLNLLLLLLLSNDVDIHPAADIGLNPNCPALNLYNLLSTWIAVAAAAAEAAVIFSILFVAEAISDCSSSSRVYDSSLVLFIAWKNQFILF